MAVSVSYYVQCRLVQIRNNANVKHVLQNCGPAATYRTLFVTLQVLQH